MFEHPAQDAGPIASHRGKHGDGHEEGIATARKLEEEGHSLVLPARKAWTHVGQNGSRTSSAHHARISQSMKQSVGDPCIITADRSQSLGPIKVEMRSLIQPLEQETGELDGWWPDSLQCLESVMRHLPVTEQGPQSLLVGQKRLVERRIPGTRPSPVRSSIPLGR